MKTVRCLYDALHDPLSLTILSGNGALGSFFKVSTDKYFQMETLDPEEDPLTWWRYPNDVPTSFKIGQEIFVYSCHKFLYRASLKH